MDQQGEDLRIQLTDLILVGDRQDQAPDGGQSGAATGTQAALLRQRPGVSLIVMVVGGEDVLRQTAQQPPYSAMELQVLGPAPASVVKVNGSYRYRLLLLGENNAQVRGLLSSFMRAFAQRPENRRLHIRVDCDLMG